MRRGSHRGGSACAGRDGRGWLRGLSTLGACLAILLHAFIVETHVGGLPHAVASIGRVAAGGGDADTTVHVQALAERADPQACLICQALAGGGRAVLASAPQLPSADDLAGAGAAVRIRYVRVAPSHAWRSRAPPALL